MQVALPGMDQPARRRPRRADVHGIQPWTVLRADTGPWQQRKKWWQAQGLDDAGGRPDAAVYPPGYHRRVNGGRSTFDPVLAEACIAWYSPAGGRVLDPMAGGPTRGLVAAVLGRDYVGVDLLASQVEHNQTVYSAWRPRPAGRARWVHGDARVVLPTLPGGHDYALTCPPYWRLERYSDDPRDLSTMPLGEFLTEHTRIITQTVNQLADHCFATWVVGDLRDSQGDLCQLPRHTIAAFERAGARLVNDQILVTPVGTRHWHARHQFVVGRAATRLHQHVLTFVKGDRKRAAARCNTPEGIALC